MSPLSSRFRILLLAISVAAPTLLAPAQVVILDRPGRRPAQEFGALVKNTAKVKVTLRLDRAEYFPNEDAELTVNLANTGALPLEVFEPFEPLTGTIDLFKLQPGKPRDLPASWRRQNLPFELPIPPDHPTSWIHVGQQLTRKFLMSDAGSWTETKPNGKRLPTICHICTVPGDEGEYQWRYSYGSGGRVDFKVVWPRFEQWTQVRLEKSIEHRGVDPDGRPRKNLSSSAVSSASLL